LTEAEKRQLLAMVTFLHFTHGSFAPGPFWREIAYTLWGAWEYLIAHPEKFLPHLAQAWQNWTCPVDLVTPEVATPDNCPIGDER
jgi:hypothetical protein